MLCLYERRLHLIAFLILTLYNIQMLLVVLTYLLQLRIIVGNPFPLHLTISTAPLPLFVHLYNKAPPFPVFSPPTTAGLYPVIRWKEDHIVSVGCLALNPRNAFVPSPVEGELVHIQRMKTCFKISTSLPLRVCTLRCHHPYSVLILKTHFTSFTVEGWFPAGPRTVMIHPASQHGPERAQSDIQEL